MKIAIHWFRRDLRVSDNTALIQASLRAEQVIPVFIFEDAFRTGPDVGAARLAFLLRSMESLREELLRLGYKLIVRQGLSEIELPKLCAEIRAEAVFCNKRYEAYAQLRDQRVFNALNAIGVGFESFKDSVIWEERDILTRAGNPFTVFTPYSRAWKERAIPPPQPRLKPAGSNPKRIFSSPLPRDPKEFGHELRQTVSPAGERSALETLEKFLAGPVHNYDEARNHPGSDGTSHLSPHLRCGTIGVRTILKHLAAADSGADKLHSNGCRTFLNELIWREFYLQVLSNFPHVMKGCFRREFDALRWSHNQEHFQAWCEGRTGYPIVDAAMRCLNSTGWMHNRLRMIVAMFLTKDLLIHWQLGERYFMQQLVDGDMAANNGGWQWSAGTGTDAAPYFRIFNPVSQAEKCDAGGGFARKWLPELSGLPPHLIHQPWKEPATLKQSKYPGRIVIHEEQRPKCLAMFQAVKAR